MEKHYHHLTYNNRLLIKHMVESGCSIKVISQKLGVHVATIYRELNRLKNASQYDPKVAQQNYLNGLKDKGRKAKLELDEGLSKYISKMILEDELSPVEIVARLRSENYPDFPSSKTTIYAAIDKGLIPSVTRTTLLLKRKKTHMFSNGLIKIPRWICQALDLKDNEDLDIDVENDGIIIKKSVKR